MTLVLRRVCLTDATTLFTQSDFNVKLRQDDHALKSTDSAEYQSTMVVSLLHIVTGSRSKIAQAVNGAVSKFCSNH